jgi:hypothetical protein
MSSWTFICMWLTITTCNHRLQLQHANCDQHLSTYATQEVDAVLYKSWKSFEPTHTTLDKQQLLKAWFINTDIGAEAVQ